MSRDFGYEAQQVAEKHLAACEQALFEDEDTEGGVESPASALFCGCETCVVREVLYAAWQVMDAYIDDALGPMPPPARLTVVSNNEG